MNFSWRPLFSGHFWYAIVFAVAAEIRRVEERAEVRGLTAGEWRRLRRLRATFAWVQFYANNATGWEQRRWNGGR